jgi:hypothetical protein
MDDVGKTLPFSDEGDLPFHEHESMLDLFMEATRHLRADGLSDDERLMVDVLSDRQIVADDLFVHDTRDGLFDHDTRDGLFDHDNTRDALFDHDTRTDDLFHDTRADEGIDDLFHDTRADEGFDGLDEPRVKRAKVEVKARVQSPLGDHQVVFAAAREYLLTTPHMTCTRGDLQQALLERNKSIRLLSKADYEKSKSPTHKLRNMMQARTEKVRGNEYYYTPNGLVYDKKGYSTYIIMRKTSPSCVMCQLVVGEES